MAPSNAPGRSRTRSRPRTLILAAAREEATAALAAELRNRFPRIDLAVAQTPPESRALLPDAEVALGFSLDADRLEAAPDLAWFQALSAGVDHLDLDRFAEAGVTVTTASGVHAEPIAEQVLGYLLTFERRLHRAHRQQHRGVWEGYSAGELRGKTVCVAGLGAIGSRVAERCAAIGCRVVGTKRDPATAPDAADEVRPPAGLHDLLPEADHVVVACPLTDETEYLFDGEAFVSMRSSATFVNVARGGVHDQEALVDALRSREIGGAALDVFEEEPLPPESPLWNLSNVVLTPHMAGSTPHYWERIAGLFAENYRAYRAGEDLTNRVA
jgi:phosphoglycerate dehydrogenase-like enzyme